MRQNGLPKRAVLLAYAFLVGVGSMFVALALPVLVGATDRSDSQSVTLWMTALIGAFAITVGIIYGRRARRRFRGNTKSG